MEKQFQTHCIYPHPQIDSVQIEALEYDSDINGHLDQPSTPSHADNTQAEATPFTSKSEENSMSPQDSTKIESQSIFDENPAEHPPIQSTKPIPEHYQEGNRHKLENIPELEEEDWEEGQFANADLIDCHNTTHESIR